MRSVLNVNMFVFHIIYKMLLFDFRFSMPFASHTRFYASTTHIRTLDVALDDFGCRLLYQCSLRTAASVGGRNYPPQTLCKPLILTARRPTGVSYLPQVESKPYLRFWWSSWPNKEGTSHLCFWCAPKARSNLFWCAYTHLNVHKRSTISVSFYSCDFAHLGANIDHALAQAHSVHLFHAHLM